jgi:hypothetical protein
LDILDILDTLAVLGILDNQDILDSLDILDTVVVDMLEDMEADTTVYTMEDKSYCILNYKEHYSISPQIVRQIKLFGSSIELLCKLHP